MTEQTKRLAAWFELWATTKIMLEYADEPEPESQELINALLALAED